MASTTVFRDTEHAGDMPKRGTFPAAANKYFARGTIVQRDAAGRATPGAAGNGFPACGVSAASYDNRTTSEFGGAADAIDLEIEYGVFGFDYVGTPLPGETVWVADNQTVTDDSNAGANGVAGVCSEVRNGQCYVWMGPHVADLFSDDSALGSAVTTLQQKVAVSQTGYRGIPLTSFVDADGDPLAKFVSAGTPTFGFNLADSEALCLRWNNDATPGTALCQVSLPADLDDTASMDLEFLCSKSGATVGDATTLTITAFILSPGDLHDADANAGGVTGALVGNATAKTTALLTRTIAAADVPASARTMTFTVTPTAGTLGTDDLMIHSVNLKYTRKAS